MFFNLGVSFYPLYPPAESVPLDSSLAPEALQLSLIPDVLILPSDIKYFVKVNDCLGRRFFFPDYQISL